MLGSILGFLALLVVNVPVKIGELGGAVFVECVGQTSTSSSNPGWL